MLVHSSMAIAQGLQPWLCILVMEGLEGAEAELGSHVITRVPSRCELLGSGQHCRERLCGCVLPSMVCLHWAQIQPRGQTPLLSSHKSLRLGLGSGVLGILQGWRVQVQVKLGSRDQALLLCNVDKAPAQSWESVKAISQCHGLTSFVLFIPRITDNSRVLADKASPESPGTCICGYIYSAIKNLWLAWAGDVPAQTLGSIHLAGA